MAARCVHMAGETDAHHRIVPTCHAVGWVAPLVVYMLPTAMGLARTEVPQRLLASTEVLCSSYFVCLCVL